MAETLVLADQMTVTIIAAAFAFLLWVVFGGIVAILVCPLLKSRVSR